MELELPTDGKKVAATSTDGNTDANMYLYHQSYQQSVSSVIHLYLSSYSIFQSCPHTRNVLFILSAVFPENQVDSVETILRLSHIDDSPKTDVYRKKLLKDVDLGRPLTVSSIQALLNVCTNERAKKVLALIIENSAEGADDPNSTSNNNPTAEMIVNLLPPGTIPIDWVLKQAPSMMPRFFSIVSSSVLDTPLCL